MVMRSGASSSPGGKKQIRKLCAWCSSLVATLVLHESPRKHSSLKFGGRAHLTSCYLTVLTVFACFSMLRFLLLWQPPSPPGCDLQQKQFQVVSTDNLPLAPHRVDAANMTARERAFWRQPDGAGYVGCIEFSAAFRQESVKVVGQRDKYLMVVVNGGLNQQRNQIVDSVVMARVLGASLVAPIMEVNQIWEDESEFSDIFDMDHFKETLKDEVRIVSSLPSTHVMLRPVEEKHTPLHASPRWLRQHYNGKISRGGVLVLRGLDSRLSKDLPSDLQRLRCKTAFHALRFARPVQELGLRLAERMWTQGPYLALHLRLEIDVWIRTGCLPGLGPDFDAQIRLERKTHPTLLTARGAKMGFTDRKMAGLCPLTGAEVARLLKALGASNRTRIYWAGGEPFGKQLALAPLEKEFPELYNKESLATAAELGPFTKKASSLAAIDYLVCLYSDVFLQSHGGNFGRVMQGHRAYMGHRKHIVPNKRQMIAHFLNSTMAPAEFDETIRALHQDRDGRPVVNSYKDVLAHPVPECMCQKPSSENPSVQ